MAIKQRAELRVHTKMSAMSGVSNADDYLKRAKDAGIYAVAFTDTKTVQACMEATENPVKQIFGIDIGYTLLARTSEGIKEINIINSKLNESNKLTDRQKQDIISENRKHLLVGSGCYSTLNHTALSGNTARLESEASFFDYIEICPGMDKDAVRVITDIAEELDIPVCAVSNAYCASADDVILNRIIRNGEGCNHMFTADEMEAEFSYLGEKKVHEIVFKNPRKICGGITFDASNFAKTLPERIQSCTDISLQDEAYANASRYRNDLPKPIFDRLERELDTIYKNNFAVYYDIASKIAECAKEKGFSVIPRGTFASSLVGYLCNITDIDPLPAHYYCPECGKIEFAPSDFALFGCDLPPRKCECGANMKGDGFNIPFECSFGLSGSKEPDLAIIHSEGYSELIYEDIQCIAGKGAFIERIINKLNRNTAKERIDEYTELVYVDPSEYEISDLAKRLCGVKTDTEPLPRRVYITGCYDDIFIVTALSGDLYGGIPVANEFCRDIRGKMPIKLEVLEYEKLDMLDALEKATGKNRNQIPLDDKDVINLFASENDITTDLFDTETGKNIIKNCAPKNFTELVTAYALCHGVGTWKNNAEKLLSLGIMNLPATCDDVFLSLIRYGVDRVTAYKAMEAARKPNPIPQEITSSLYAYGVPKLYIGALSQIGYMMPKATAVERTRVLYCLAWYKLYYPKEVIKYLFGDKDYYELIF